MKEHNFDDNLDPEKTSEADVSARATAERTVRSFASMRYGSLLASAISQQFKNRKTTPPIGQTVTKTNYFRQLVNGLWTLFARSPLSH